MVKNHKNNIGEKNMLVTQNRFHAPKRMAFGNLHNFSNKPEAKSGATIPTTSPEQQLAEMTKKYTHERGLKRATMLGSLITAVVVFVSGNNTDNKIEALNTRQSQTTALLSEATNGRINKNNLDKAIESREADSLLQVARNKAHSLTQAFQKSLTQDSLRADSLRRISGR